MKFPGVPGRPVDAMCSPEELDPFKQIVSKQGIQIEEIIENMGALLRSKESMRSRVVRQTASMNWNHFQRYATILKWMEGIAIANPSFTELINMGTSVQGRKMYALKIGLSPLGKNTRAVWVDGGIHAREWIATSTATYILKNLVENFSASYQSNCSDKVITSVDWYIAPLLNPDGYEFSHTNDRLWRKNRRAPAAGKDCYGVDINRNWGVVGYGVGASSSTCSETYKGPSKNSEPETTATAATI